jgi:hypothetical protein
VYFQQQLTRYQKSQWDVSDKAVKMKIIEKLAKVRKRGYLALGLVESLTAFFGVPKGEDAICLVYNSLVGGLNLTILVQRFFCPTICTHFYVWLTRIPTWPM